MGLFLTGNREMASLDTVPSVLGTTPAPLGADAGTDGMAPTSLWMKGVFWIALGLLAWGSYGYWFR